MGYILPNMLDYLAEFITYILLERKCKELMSPKGKLNKETRAV